MPFDDSRVVPFMILAGLVLALALLTSRIVYSGPTYFKVCGWIATVLLGVGFAEFASYSAKRPLNPQTSVVARKDGESAKLSLGTSLRVPPSVLELHIKRAEGYRHLGAIAGVALGLALFVGGASGYAARRRKMRNGIGAAIKVTDVVGFVDMLAAACENAGMQGTLEKLLGMPDAQRRELLGQIIHQMRERRAPKDIIDAFICLQDDTIAEKAYEAVYKCPRNLQIAPLNATGTVA